MTGKTILGPPTTNGRRLNTQKVVFGRTELQIRIGKHRKHGADSIVKDCT